VLSLGMEAEISPFSNVSGGSTFFASVENPLD
jgi:hypothetical protein